MIEQKGPKGSDSVPSYFHSANNLIAVVGVRTAHAESISLLRHERTAPRWWGATGENVELDMARTEAQTPLESREATMPESKIVGPKHGDHVSSNQHNGIFEVVAVNALMQAANIRAIDGSGSVIPNVPWTALKPANK